MSLLQEMEPIGDLIILKRSLLNELRSKSVVDVSAVEELETDIAQLETEFFNIWQGYRVGYVTTRPILIGGIQREPGSLFYVYRDDALRLPQGKVTRVV